jgi:uncharacterized protein (TIGR03032 family)
MTGPKERPAAAGGDSPSSLPVNYACSRTLPELLERLQCFLVISTYQAGRLVSIGSQAGELRIGFARFPQAMGLARTSTVLSVGSQATIWSLPAYREIAPSLSPRGSHDIAFLSRTAHHCGPVLGHVLAWCGDRLWRVNTLFNCLCALEAPWSFVPRWHPPFISSIPPPRPVPSQRAGGQRGLQSARLCHGAGRLG